jgi:hypothetical protein
MGSVDAPQPPDPTQPSQDTEPGRERPQASQHEDAEWGDGDTLFDAQVEALRAATQSAQAQASQKTVGAGLGDGAAGPPEDLTDNDATARIQRATDGEAERAAAPAREGKREERPTALLDMVPMPPQGQVAERRWAQGAEPTSLGMSRQPAVPDDERSLWPTLVTAAAAVLVGVLLGMGILRLYAGRGAPSMALEGSQQLQQQLLDGEQLLRAGQRAEACKRAGAVLAAEPTNTRALRLKDRCERP